MELALTGLITYLESRQLGSRFSHGAGSEYYLHIGENAIGEAAGWLAGRQGMSLIAMWAARKVKKAGTDLFYAFNLKPSARILIVVVDLKSGRVPSIYENFPVAVYFERRVSDAFGLEFDDSPDRRRLFLHEAYPPDFHPMLESCTGQPSQCVDAEPGSGYVFKKFEGEGIYEVPVGPVHAGIIEPGHFRFSVMGETIFNLEVRLGYKHRGLNKLAEGKTGGESMKFAEAVSGDESAANACCFAMTVEKIAGVQPSRRTWELRTLLLEMERIYSHLGDLAGMLVDVAWPMGASPFFILREEILRWNDVLTGSRFLKGFVKPGGLRGDIEPGKLVDLKRYLPSFARSLERALSGVEESAWVIDRFETTGIVKPELLAPLSLSGPTARASGDDADIRRSHPYGIYGELRFEVPVKTGGDVLARFRVKAEEIKASVRIINEVIVTISDGPVWLECLPGSGQAVSVVEAARGRNLHWLRFESGRIEHWEVITASFCNWLAIEHAVIGNIVPDFPVINKSFNLSYAGNDL